MTKGGTDREAELIEDIARQLGVPPADRGHVRDQCQTLREQFRANVEDEIGATEKRNRFREVERTCGEAAKAVARAPQDHEWLPEGEFTLRGRRFKLTIGSTKIATLLWMLSELAGETAKKLVLPKARAEPQKDLTALYMLVLCTEFSAQEPNTSPTGPYLSAAPLLFEFFTGTVGAPLESSCRKILEQYPSRRRLRQRRRRKATAG